MKNTLLIIVLWLILLSLASLFLWEEAKILHMMPAAGGYGIDSTQAPK